MARARFKRLIYKRVVDGDLKKLRRESNLDKKQGGGARDIRFNPWTRFEPVIARMFPADGSQHTNRGGQKTVIQIRVGNLQWSENGVQGMTTIRFWPPYGTRKGDGRLAEIHKIPIYDPHHYPGNVSNWKPTDPAVFYLIWEDANGVWAQYATEQDLKTWNNPRITQPILAALSRGRADDPAANVRGFIDVDANEEWHSD